MRVTIDITKPLKTGFFLPIEKNVVTWIQFWYEKLNDFCYSCGRLGHGHKNCNQSEDTKGVLDPRKAYGPWLRVGFTQSSTLAKKTTFQLWLRTLADIQQLPMVYTRWFGHPVHQSWRNCRGHICKKYST